MTVKIDKNMPKPARRYGPGPKYRWEEMEIGDSFVVKGTPPSAYSIARKANMRYAPRKFEAGVVEEGGVKVGRIWRMK